MKLQGFSCVFTAMIVTGCASTAPATNNSLEQDPAFQMLARSARNIEQSLTQLAEAEQFDKMKVQPGQPRIFEQIRGMEQVVTMPWQGTLEQATVKLATFSGFEVKFYGKAPVTPILVQIGRDPATISDHLRNLGIQAGSRADLIVDPTKKIVGIKYGNGGL